MAPAKVVDAVAQLGGRVIISEIASGSPGGYHDNLIEVATELVGVTGWELFRFTGTGSQSTLQGTIGAGGG